MVSHERPTAIVANDLKRQQNPASAWEDFDPPQKKHIFEVTEAKTPTAHNVDQVPVFEDDGLMELLSLGSQPAGCQDHEDTQQLCARRCTAMMPLHSFQVDGGTQPAETEQTYGDSQVGVQYST